MFENLDAEQGVIGVMLKSGGDNTVVSYCMTLNETDFADESIREIFKAAKEIAGRGETVDIINLGKELSRMGVSYAPKELLQYAAVTPAYANYKSHVNAVRECSERRRVRAVAYELMEQSEAGDLKKASYDAVKALNGETGGADSWLDMFEIVSRAFDRINDTASGKVTPIKTGVGSLDNFFGGFNRGELTILAARPSVGKSAFGIFLAMQAARNGKRVAFVSREMSPENIANRMLSSENKALRGEKLRDAKLSEDDWIILGDAVNELTKLPIYSIYSVRTMETLQRAVRGLEAKSGKLDLLIVDYAQLMHTLGKNESRVEELEEVSGAAKGLAMDLDLPVLLLAQVKRSGQRTAVMPTMDELKGSGAFEQDADNILLMHRPDSAEDEVVKMLGDGKTFENFRKLGLQYIVIRVAKQRQGQIGGAALCYDPAHNTYTAIQR